MNILYYKLLLFFLNIGYFHSHITYRILHSSALHFMPFMKMHHIFLITDNPEYYVYTLDFSPINQKNASTLLKLLFARNVPAEIRLRQVMVNIDNIEIIKDKWNAMNEVDAIISSKITNNFYNKIRNTKIKNIVSKSFQWHSYMNLYTHNCQHFSRFVNNITYLEE